MKVGNYPVNAQNVNQQSAGVSTSQNQLQISSSTGTGGLPQSLSSLTQGQMFEATITRDESGKITIHLANGESVSARMEGAVQLLENTATFFEVKSNQGGHLALKAVTQEPGANPTLIKALAQAGVAIDEGNLHLVQEMMKQQLPIDAKSLANMVRLAYNNKGIAPTTLVQLTKLGLPVTKENIAQFQQYTAGEGNMVKTLDNLMQQLPQSLEHFQGTGTNGEEIFSRLQQIFIQDFGGTVLPQGNTFANGPMTFQDLMQSLDAISQTNEQVMIANQGDGTVEITVPNGSPNLGPSGEITSGQMQATTTEQTIQQGTPLQNGAEIINGDVSGMENNPALQENAEGEQTRGIVSGNDNLSPKEQFFRLAAVIQHMNLKDTEYQALFQHKGFQTLLNQVMEQEWLLTPEQVKGERIKEVYEKLQTQLEKLESLLNQLGQNEQTATQGTKEVRSNIQFINDLNQFYNYVQIPLNMANENAKGDLYVYTDKRAIKQGKEELTAHLHLELEHLGITDVYVRLKEKKLSTNFIMEKEESFDLVMKHMDRLTRRLQEKGFSVSTTVELSGEDTKAPDFMQEILNRELPSIAIQRYSLDVIV